MLNEIVKAACKIMAFYFLAKELIPGIGRIVLELLHVLIFRSHSKEWCDSVERTERIREERRERREQEKNELKYGKKRPIGFSTERIES